MFLERFLGKKPKPVNPKKEGGHGDHWYPFDFIKNPNILRDAILENVKTSTNIITKTKSGKTGVGYVSDSKDLNILSLAVNNEIYSAYPFLENGEINKVKLTGITEWANEFEAQLSVEFGAALFNIFDTFYFKNYDAYQIGHEYSFKIAAIAYRLTKVMNPEESIGKDSKMSKDFSGAFPFDKGDIDDYILRTQIGDVRKTTFHDEPLYSVKVPICRPYNDMSKPFSAVLFASEKILDGYVPKKGDVVEGTVWLQGHI